jgi:hypothetical protein
MSNDIDEYQKAAIGTVTGRLSKAEKLEMYKLMYNVTNNRVTNREPGEPKGYLIDEADELPPLVGIDYSSIDDRMAAFWLGVENRRIPVTTGDFMSIPPAYILENPKPGPVGRTNYKAIAKRRARNKAARKSRAKAR